jgi:hypothetical protein
MVKFTITGQTYVLKIRNQLSSEVPYNVTEIDPTIPPGTVQPSSEIELTITPQVIPIINPCVQLLVIPYNYNRPVFVEFSADESAPSIQNIDLTEMPGFTLVENHESVDRISEVGYNVQLHGENTSNIVLDVFFQL